jgi:hypothetical protein
MLFAGAAFADEYKFPNGVSFSYPSGYQTQETKQAPSTIITLFNASDPTMSFVAVLTEGGASDPAVNLNFDETAYKAALPQGMELLTYKKITIGGKDAILVESAMDQNGAYVFSRSVAIISGQDLVSVGAAYMSKDKVDAGREVSEGIENSLKF